MAAMTLAPANGPAMDAKTCRYGCCGGAADFPSVAAARRAARRREARAWKREADADR